MPDNAPTRRQHFNHIVEQALSGTPLPQSRNALGHTHSEAESQRFIEAVGPSIGPSAIKAANLFASHYLQRLSEADDQALQIEEDLDHQGQLPAPERENAPRSLVPLDEAEAIVAYGMLAPRQDQQMGDALSERANWHQFLNMVPDRRVGTMMAGDVFGIFPCFRSIGNSAATQLKMAMAISEPERPNATTRMLLDAPQGRRMQQGSTDTETLNVLANWIGQNAGVVNQSVVKFPDMMPGYMPKIMFTVSEDETFLLVVEDAGKASYSFDLEEWTLSISPAKGETIQTGDVLEVLKPSPINLAWVDLDDSVNFPDGSGLSIAQGQNTPNGETTFNLIYSGDTPLREGEQISAQLQDLHNTTSSQSLRMALANCFDPIGTLNAGRGGNAPLSARYIYSWPGGRQYYANNPDKLHDLINLMTAKDGISINLTQEPTENLEAENVREIAPQAERPINAAINRDQDRPVEVIASAVESTPKPAPTPSEKGARSARHLKTKTAAGAIKLLALLRANFGFIVQDATDSHTGQTIKAATLKVGDGFIVASPADGKKLPLASAFQIERKPALLEAGDLLGEISSSMTEDELSSAMSEYLEPPAPTPGM